MLKVFTGEGCAPCKMLKSYLDYKNVEYTAYDREQYKEDFIELTRRSGQTSVPQIDLGNQVIVGYNLEALSKALS